MTRKLSGPQLRFKDEAGNDFPDWEEKNLGSMGTFISGGTPDTSVPDYWNGNIPWFTPTEIKKKYVSKSNKTITERGLKNSSAKLLPGGTVLISTRATVGNVGIAETQCATNQGFQSLLVNDSEINTFWYYWIIQHKNELIRRASGSTFLEIGKSEISKIIALRPDKEEQQKIVGCLSSIDELITAQTQKVDALVEHKKGLMQKLFRPALRFKDEAGNDFPDWEERKLGSLGKFKSGIGFSNAEQGGQEGVPFYKVSCMNVLGNERVMIKSNNYVTDEQIHRLNYKPIMQNAIIFAKVGAAIFLERKRLANNFLLDNNMMAFIPTINLLFMKYVFDNTRLSRFSQVGALPSYNASDLASIKVHIPVSPKEKQKIVGCLSSIDELITAQTQKVDALVEHKKGLVQKLFPRQARQANTNLKGDNQS